MKIKNTSKMMIKNISNSCDDVSINNLINPTTKKQNNYLSI